MRIKLLDTDGDFVLDHVFSGSVLFQITRPDRHLAIGIVEGLLTIAKEDGDTVLGDDLETILAELEGEYSPSPSRQSESISDLDVRVLQDGGNLILRDSFAGTVIFIFEPPEELGLAIDILESMLSVGLFCQSRSMKVRSFIESIEGAVACMPQSYSRLVN